MSKFLDSTGLSYILGKIKNTFVQKSSIPGLLKNDGTIDTNTYITSSGIVKHSYSFNNFDSTLINISSNDIYIFVKPSQNINLKLNSNLDSNELNVYRVSILTGSSTPTLSIKDYYNTELASSITLQAYSTHYIEIREFYDGIFDITCEIQQNNGLSGPL